MVLAGLLACSPAEASHDWVGLDLCRTYPERMPPELNTRLFPDPDSDGARLVGRYCSQCHFAPGPGQHTAAEWAELVPRMSLLMEVTARFGTRSPPTERPSTGERAELLAYLERYALRPLVDPSAAPPAYRSLCGDCHAAPAPAAYAGTDWSELLGRMLGHRVTMLRPPADPLAQAQVAAYLGISVAPAGDPVPTAKTEGAPRLTGDPGRWLALGPILFLSLLGFVRWWLRQGARR